jgi:hypothetical protein
VSRRAQCLTSAGRELRSRVREGHGLGRRHPPRRHRALQFRDGGGARGGQDALEATTEEMKCSACPNATAGSPPSSTSERCAAKAVPTQQPRACDWSGRQLRFARPRHDVPGRPGVGARVRRLLNLLTPAPAAAGIDARVRARRAGVRSAALDARNGRAARAVFGSWLALASSTARARAAEAQTPTEIRRAALVCAQRRVSSPLGVFRRVLGWADDGKGAARKKGRLIHAHAL